MSDDYFKPEDIEKKFRVRINDLITDFQTNSKVMISKYGKLLYDNRSTFYKELGYKFYRPLTFDLAVSNFKVSSLAIELFDGEKDKGDIISIKKSVYDDELSYVRVMRRTVQDLDDIGLLIDNFKSK